MRKKIFLPFILIITLFSIIALFIGCPYPITYTINFDDVSAQGLFSATTALRDSYASLGVTFSGPAANDGGAILIEGGFSVTGYSSPNFLAFNTAGPGLSDGGVPRGPETLTFSTPISSLSLKAGHNSMGTFSIIAYDSSDNIIDSDTLPASSTLTYVTVSGQNIKYVVFSFTGNLCVVDDLSFTTM